MPIIVSSSAVNPPAPTTATSSDGVLTIKLDPLHAGVLLRANFASAAIQPDQVRFLRADAPVRSGDPALAPGGRAVAYDHEAPFGTASAWQAVPITKGVEGPPSAGASLLLPEIMEDVDCWLKPEADPSAAMALPLVENDPEYGYDVPINMMPVPGSPYPVGTWDIGTPVPRTAVLRTATVAQRDYLFAALNQGPVLVQRRSSFGVPDEWCQPTAVRESYFVGAHDTRRNVTVTLQPVRRPATIDAPLIVPGRSYADSTAAGRTYAGRKAFWPTYADALQV